MHNQSQLEKAIQFAIKAHAGQVDKQGEPYILHPLRVMLAQSTTTAKIVAVLHDVMEDVPIPWNDIRGLGFGDEVVIAIAALTRLPIGETYMEYIKRVSENKLAREVKLADLADNLRRMDGLDEPDRTRLGTRYIKAVQYLGEVRP